MGASSTSLAQGTLTSYSLRPLRPRPTGVRSDQAKAPTAQQPKLTRWVLADFLKVRNPYGLIAARIAEVRMAMRTAEKRSVPSMAVDARIVGKT